MLDKEKIYNWLATKKWLLTEKENYFEYKYERDYDDFISEEQVLEIINENTKEKRYDKFYELLDNCNFYDYENETIFELAKEYCNDNDIDYDIEIEEYMSTLIYFNYDSYLEESYNVNIIIDFNKQDYNTDFANSSNLNNCKNNNLYTLLRKQGYYKKDYNKNIKNGGSRFLTSIKEEIDNNCYDYLTSIVVLKKISLRDLIENDNFIVNTNNTIGLFNWCYGSGSLLEIELEKDFIINRDKDIFTIQVEGAGRNVGYNVNEVFGLIGSCWQE